MPCRAHAAQKHVLRWHYTCRWRHAAGTCDGRWRRAALRSSTCTQRPSMVVQSPMRQRTLMVCPHSKIAQTRLLLEWLACSNPPTCASMDLDLDSDAAVRCTLCCWPIIAQNASPKSLQMCIMHGLLSHAYGLQMQRTATLYGRCQWAASQQPCGCGSAWATWPRPYPASKEVLP